MRRVIRGNFIYLSENFYFFIYKMDSNFNADFMNFFNPNTSKEARKNFRCRLCDLYLNHPDIFCKGYNLGKNRLGISYYPDKEEEAKEILKNVYIPYLKVSKYNVKNKYITKSGEVRTYNYTTTYVSQRKENSVSEQLKDIVNSEEGQKILKEKNIPIYLKVSELKDLPNFPKNITSEQLKQYIYRLQRN